MLTCCDMTDSSANCMCHACRINEIFHFFLEKPVTSVTIPTTFMRYETQKWNTQSRTHTFTLFISFIHSYRHAFTYTTVRVSYYLIPVSQKCNGQISSTAIKSNTCEQRAMTLRLSVCVCAMRSFNSSTISILYTLCICL